MYFGVQEKLNLFLRPSPHPKTDDFTRWLIEFAYLTNGLEIMSIDFSSILCQEKLCFFLIWLQESKSMMPSLRVLVLPSYFPRLENYRISIYTVLRRILIQFKYFLMSIFLVKKGAKPFVSRNN